MTYNVNINFIKDAYKSGWKNKKLAHYAEHKLDVINAEEFDLDSENLMIINIMVIYYLISAINKE